MNIYKLAGSGLLTDFSVTTRFFVTCISYMTLLLKLKEVYQMTSARIGFGLQGQLITSASRDIYFWTVWIQIITNLKFL